MYLTACAQNIQWLLDNYSDVEGHLEIQGWAIPVSGKPEEAKFLINGRLFEEVSYPLSSPDLGEFFWNIPAAQACRFRCKTAIDPENVYLWSSVL
jgi:hypothetical protein